MISDNLDPSGMFSKAGRLSLEMYSMLQEKDYILNNKKKMQKLQDIQIQQSMKSLQAKQTLTNEKHRTFQIRASNSTKNLLATAKQPFGKMICRDQYQQLQEKLTSNNQKFGMYNPKFHLIYEKSPLYPDLESQDNKQRARQFQQQNLHYSLGSKRQKTMQKRMQQLQLQQLIQNDSIIINKSIVSQAQPANMSQSIINLQSQQPQSLNQSVINQQAGQQLNQSSIQTAIKLNHSVSEPSILGIDFDKPRHRIIGPIPLDKQSQRKPMMTSSIPHDKRFEYLEFPQVYSKCQRLPNIQFDTQQRDHKVFGSKTGGLDYNVNYDYVHPRLSIGVLDYSKLSQRKSETKPIYSLNERIGDDYLFSLAQSKSQILKKVKVPKFDKMHGRGHSLHEKKLEQIDIDLNQYKSKYI